MSKIKKQRKEIWVETELGIVPSKEAVERLEEIFKPSPTEVAMHENSINRFLKDGLLAKGKDGNYYPTKKATSFLPSDNL